MKIFKLIKWVIVLSILVVASSAGYGTYIYKSYDKEKLEALIKSKSGYTVHLDGETSVQLFPKPSFKVGEVKVVSFSGTRPIFHAKNLQAEFSLSELLHLGVGMKRFSLEQPTIYLHVDHKGVPSWEPKRKKREGSNSAGALKYIKSIGDIVISDAEVIYENDKEGQQFEVQDIQINIGGHELSETDAGIALNINGVPILASLQTELNNLNNVPIKSNIKIGKNEIELDGKIKNLLSEFSYEGSVTIDGPEMVEDILHILRLPEDVLVTRVPVKVKAEIKYSPKLIDLNYLVAEFGNRGTGNIAGNVSLYPASKKKANKVTGDLTFGAPFDLAVFGLCRPIINKVTSKTNETWPTRPVDISSLKGYDIDLGIYVETLMCDKMVIDQIKANVKNEKNKLTISNLEIKSGDGSVVSEVSHNYARKSHKGEMSMEINKFPVESLISPNRATVLDLPVSGNSTVSYHGMSIAEWVNSLTGQVTLNSERMQTNIPLNNLAFAVETLFSKRTGMTGDDAAIALDADFIINDGIIRTNKLHLTNENISLKGEGKVDLNRLTIKYRISPMGTNNIGVNIPVLIKGNLSNPTILPDALSPQGIGMGIGTVLGGPVGAGVGAAIGSMIDGNGDGTSSTENPAKGLMNIFGF